MQQIASQNAPSPALVVPHFVFGGLAWLTTCVMILFFPDAFMQHYFNPVLLSITHLMALGFISIIIYGALYQLVPVILEVRLYNEFIGKVSMYMQIIGTALLCITFWNMQFGMLFHFSVLFLLLGVLLFAVNIFMTAASSTTRNIEKSFIRTAVMWLVFTVLLGILLAYNLKNPFFSVSHLELLKLHAHAGLIGWFFMLIMGVATRLLPMFLLSHNLSTKSLKFTYYLVNFALVSGMVFGYFQWKYVIFISVLAGLAGIIIFLLFLVKAYRTRMKKKLDIGMRQTFVAFVFFVIPVILLIIILFGSKYLGSLGVPSGLAYGSTIFIGFITSLILGQTYKTLPFIVWLHRYKDKAGKESIPFPRDLYSTKMAIIQLWTFAPGFTIFLLAIFFKIEYIFIVGSGLMLFSALVYNFNILKIIFHKPTQS